MTHFIIDRFHLIFQGVMLFQVFFFGTLYLINSRKDELYYCLMNVFASAYFFLNAPHNYLEIDHTIVFNGPAYIYLKFCFFLLLSLFYLLFLHEMFNDESTTFLLQEVHKYTAWLILILFTAFTLFALLEISTSALFYAAHLINAPYVAILLYYYLSSTGFKSLIIKGMFVIFICVILTILFTLRHNLGLKEVVFDHYPLLFIKCGMLIDIFLFQIALLIRWNEQEKELITKDFKSKLAIEKVRNQISQELHDDIGANLNSLNFLVELLKKKPTDNGLLQKMESTISETSTLINDTIWALNPDYDSLQMVFIKIDNFAKGFLSSKSIMFDFKTDPELKLPLLTIEERRQIYLTMKEAINNAAKHSQAQHVTIEICQTDKHIMVKISDDGVGFNMDEPKSGNGLLNFKNRQINGALDINFFSKISEGTLIEIRLKK